VAASCIDVPEHWLVTSVGLQPGAILRFRVEAPIGKGEEERAQIRLHFDGDAVAEIKAGIDGKNRKSGIVGSQPNIGSDDAPDEPPFAK